MRIMPRIEFLSRHKKEECEMMDQYKFSSLKSLIERPSNFGHCLMPDSNCSCEVCGDTDEPVTTNGCAPCCNECLERFYQGKGARVPAEIDPSVRGHFNTWRELCRIEIRIKLWDGSEEQRQEIIKQFVNIANWYAREFMNGDRTKSAEQQVVDNFFAWWHFGTPSRAPARNCVLISFWIVWKLI